MYVEVDQLLQHQGISMLWNFLTWSQDSSLLSPVVHRRSPSQRLGEQNHTKLHLPPAFLVRTDRVRKTEVFYDL